MPIKLAGLGFLAFYLYSHPVQFEPLWVLIYLGIALGGIPIYIWANKLIAGVKNEAHYIEEEKEHAHETLKNTKKNNPLCFWLASAESAFFYVPLLYVGINPLSAAIAASLFGLMHYPQFLLRNCIFKVIVQYVLVLVVLPHGILTVIAGHLLMDYGPLALLKLLNKIPDPKQEQKEPNNGPKGDAQNQRTL